MYIWNEMTREEINELINGLVVVTIGATEQHGYHLPVETDNAIGRQVAYESVKKASGSIPIILGPHIPFGHSHHHFLYAGAISLSMKTVSIVLTEVVESIARSGFNKIFIVNSHGGNDELVRLVAKEISYGQKMNISAGSYWNIAGEDLTRYREKNDIYNFGHAGQFETSLMMAIKPDLVKMEKLDKEKAERQSFELNLGTVVKATTHDDVWANIDGYSDEPAKATKEYGEGLLQVISDRLSQAFIAFYHSCKNEGIIGFEK